MQISAKSISEICYRVWKKGNTLIDMKGSSDCIEVFKIA